MSRLIPFYQLLITCIDPKAPCIVHGNLVLKEKPVSMLGEGQASDATIKALRGHISNKMLETVFPFQECAKHEAISVFDTRVEWSPPRLTPKRGESEEVKVQKVID